jgi:methyl-accepting chemotaxis protein
MDKIRFQQLLLRAFWVPYGIALILAAVQIVEVQFLMNRAGWVEHTDQVITVAQRIYRSRIDQETGLRAYLLTNDRRFLQPFLQAQEQARVLEPELQRLISDNPGQNSE